MDIDLVFSNDLKESEILDIEEFESHKKDYNYSDFFIKNSLEAIEQVKELKNNKNFWRLFKWNMKYKKINNFKDAFEIKINLLVTGI